MEQTKKMINNNKKINKTLMMKNLTHLIVMMQKLDLVNYIITIIKKNLSYYRTYDKTPIISYNKEINILIQDYCVYMFSFYKRDINYLHFYFDIIENTNHNNHSTYYLNVYFNLIPTVLDLVYKIDKIIFSSIFFNSLFFLK